MFKSFSSRKIFRVIAVAIVFGFLIFWNPNNFFDFFRGIIFRVAYPFQKVLFISSDGTKQLGIFLSSIGDLKTENAKLNDENLRLAAENAMLRDMKKENDLLREQNDLFLRDRFEAQTAQVIGRDVHGVGNWIMIDKGSNDGIAEGMPVVVSGRNLVGYIKNAYAGTSQVMLLSNPESSINAQAGSNEAKGIVKGEHGLGLILDDVLQTDRINVGDEVTTSGIGADMPRGLLIGKINDVYASPDHLFQRATVFQLIAPIDLRFVSVIKSGQ
ncbi:MAG: rod shape-determining protein MreC [Candidatus Moranbacteria bacterium]|jgi:rod shape-determining protein MreC|nr:rod shape-determining protein MreC [Candidatus Moranbacteria bacterium]